MSGFPAALLNEVFLKEMLKIALVGASAQRATFPAVSSGRVGGQEGEAGSKGFTGVGEKT